MGKWLRVKELAKELEPARAGWENHAKCFGEDTGLFIYSDDNRGPTRSNRHKLEKLCEGCPVMLTCRYEAVRNDEVGWWGGMDSKQRRVWAEEELFNEDSIRAAV